MFHRKEVLICAAVCALSASSAALAQPDGGAPAANDAQPGASASGAVAEPSRARESFRQDYVTVFANPSRANGDAASDEDSAAVPSMNYRDTLNARGGPTRSPVIASPLGLQSPPG